MKSTSGLSIWPRNCRAYDDSDSTYRRWPSAKIVSNASDDLPEPDRPVKKMSLSRGRSRPTLRRVCSRAPWTTRRSFTHQVYGEGPTSVRFFEHTVRRVTRIAARQTALMSHPEGASTPPDQHREPDGAGAEGSSQGAVDPRLSAESQGLEYHAKEPGAPVRPEDPLPPE